MGTWWLVSAFLGSDQSRVRISLMFCVVPYDPRTIGCTSALRRLRCSLKAVSVSSETEEGAGKTIQEMSFIRQRDSHSVVL